MTDSPLGTATPSPFASEFREASEIAVRRWRFTPGRIDQYEDGADSDLWRITANGATVGLVRQLALDAQAWAKPAFGVEVSLGIADATHGQFRAHVVRIKRDHAGKHELHTTGLHQHKCDFQMFYVLKGWMKFIYENHGEQTFHAGDCVLQPAGIVHNELDCSDDVEILEIYSPAVHATRKVEQMPEAAAATH